MLLGMHFHKTVWTLILTSGFVTVLISWLTSILLNLDREKGHTTDEGRLFPPSSVWCQFGPSGERLCKFRNICYDSRFQEFQFTVTEDSILSGVQKPELWKNIAMSTVLGHNAFNMKISLHPSAGRTPQGPLQFHHTPTFIIHRFKPDNIMHVIHDDLIPLHFTIESLLDKSAIDKKQIALAFSDNYKESSLDGWYRHYLGSDSIALAAANGTVCFKEAYVGLNRATLWFSYGFNQPQGPFFNENFSVKGLQNYINYNFNAWKAESSSSCTFSSLCLKVVIVVRSLTRRILNMGNLIEAIKRAHGKTYPGFRLKIVKVDFAVHDTPGIISHVRQAKLLIGMHGAGLILSLFLPPKSALVELFPFAISPDNVSFMRALLKQRSSYPLHYEFWRNKERKNSLPGPQIDPLLGRISHLPDAVQSHIKGLKEVPAVRCCHNPAYLYYIYHDTYVNDEIFHPLFRAFFKTRKSSRNRSVLSEIVFPSSPVYLKCKILDNLVSIEWGEISNLKENEGIWFQITVQNGEHISIHNVTDGSSSTFVIEVEYIRNAQVWFQPFNKKNVPGLIKHTECVIEAL